jgi:Holliday junction resolvasome RuvABC endonuclease subunit
MHYFVAIDPGTRYLGWAVFCADDKKKVGYFLISGCVTKKTKRQKKKKVSKSAWIGRIDYMVDRIVDLCNNANLYADELTVLIEQPMIFGSSKGRAALNSGAVGKLVACVFQLKGAIRSELPDTEIKLLPVRQWKGNLKKHVTAKRIKRSWGVVCAEGEDDETDAVGIGDYYLRKALRYKASKDKPKTKFLGDL